MDTLSSLLAPGHALEAGAAFARPAAVDDGRRQGFRIGPLHLAIRYEHGSMLVEPPAFVRLPNAPTWFVGMSNIDGALVPIFDLASLLAMTRTPSTKPMLLVLGHGDEQAGLLIDGIPQRVVLTPQARLQEFSPPVQLSGCVVGAYRVGESDWMDLAHTALLDRLHEQLT